MNEKAVKITATILILIAVGIGLKKAWETPLGRTDKDRETKTKL